MIFSRLFCTPQPLFLHPIVETAASGVAIVGGFVF